MTKTFTYDLGDQWIVIKGIIDGSNPKVMGWKLISKSESGTITAEGEVTKQRLEYSGLKTIERSPLQQALEEGIKAYNINFPLEPGEVDIRRIFPCVINSMLYDTNSALKDIKKLMTLGVEMEELSITPEGEILWGNTRFLAAKQHNAEAKIRDESIPYPVIKAKIIHGLNNFEEKLEFIRQGNTHRIKTEGDLKREALVTVRALACRPISSKELKEEAVRLGMSQDRMKNMMMLEQIIVSEKFSQSLASNLRELAKVNPITAISIVKANPPDWFNITKEAYTKMLISKVPEGQAIKGRNYSFESAKAIIDKEILINSINNPLIKEALNLGDKVEGDFCTPTFLIELASQSMGKIDLDAFASLSDPEYVSKIIGYPVKSWTIKEDAWKKPLKGWVFANPPWHRANEALTLIDRWLRYGVEEGISKCFIVAPITVLSRKSVRRTITDFEMMIAVPDFIKFTPGLLYQSVHPNSSVVKTGQYKAIVVLFFSTEIKNYDILVDNFPGWCGKQYLNVSQSKSN